MRGEGAAARGPREEARGGGDAGPEPQRRGDRRRGGRAGDAAIPEEEHVATRPLAEGRLRVDLAEERLREGRGVEALRAEVASDPAKLFGAAEAAEARRALDDAGALAAPREEQGGVEAGDPAPDDQRLRGCQERREARHGPLLCRLVENVSQYQLELDVVVDLC